MQTPVIADPAAADALPDHLRLPDKDGVFVTNYQEHPQSDLLTTSLSPRLHQLYGENYSVGCDSGIYWKPSAKSPLAFCKAPDWFLVPNVPAMLDGEVRRSYVFWQENVRPLLVIEYVSGDGGNERDRTSQSGKFWVYEQPLGVGFYVIFDARKEEIEAHKQNGGGFTRMEPNAAGRYLIEPLGVELGLWRGKHHTFDTVWLRAWDAATGTLLPSAEERGDAASARADAAEGLIEDFTRMRDEETERAEAERKRADLAVERAEDERKRRVAAEDRERKLVEQLRRAGLAPEAE